MPNEAQLNQTILKKEIFSLHFRNIQYKPTPMSLCANEIRLVMFKKKIFENF